MTLKARWPNAAIEQAADYHEAVEAIRSRPDICIADLAMPGAEPVEGIARLRAMAPETSIFVLTGLTDDDLLDKVRECGVAAVLPKTLETSEMLAALEAALDGFDLKSGRDPLTGRRRDVLRLMTQGLTNKEIANRLLIAPATVKIHVSRVIEHFGAANRTDAVSRAQQRGLV